MDDPADEHLSANREGWWTREHALIVVLVAATALLLILCGTLLRPFFNPIAWALSLAVVAHPLHAWLERRIQRENLAAGLATFGIAVLIAGPMIFVANSIIRESSTAVKAIQTAVEDGKLREHLSRYPRVEAAVQALGQQTDDGSQFQSMAAEIGKRVTLVLAGSAWALVDLLLTLFVLFYLFRDRHIALKAVRSLVPLSGRETDEVFTRVSDTIHASIFGTLVVAAVQGALGGLMFWWLGLPAPILWGAVMALLAIVPVLGAFVIWVPVAIYLAVNGEWGKAVILTVWGGVVIGLIDNLLYPILVGKRLRLHTVPVFFSIVGGLSVFGACGLILGPVIFALTDAILEVWRRRTAHGKPAEQASTAGT
jgi:predicted PurR-regulated permease PerM